MGKTGSKSAQDSQGGSAFHVRAAPALRSPEGQGSPLPTRSGLSLSLSPPPLLFLMLSMENAAKVLELSAVAQPFSSS